MEGVDPQVLMLDQKVDNVYVHLLVEGLKPRSCELLVLLDASSGEKYILQESAFLGPSGGSTFPALVDIWHLLKSIPYS